MARKVTIEDFIERAIVIHGNKYDYTKSNYLRAKTKITIVCPIHGEFTQTPDSHLQGSGCHSCGGIKVPTTEEFIAKATLVHENKYDYSKVEYTSAEGKITVICPIHGDFEQRAHNHISGQGCSKCGIVKNHISCKSNTEEFVEKAKAIHMDKYDYSKVNYTGNKNKITIICPIHGDFEQSPSSHLRGNGCSACAEYGFNPGKAAYLYYLKITTEDNQILYKIGITNRTVDERFNLTDLSKIEIVKQKHYESGLEALDWETKLKRQFKEYQYKGPDVLSSGNTELFTEDIIALWDSQ